MIKEKIFWKQKARIITFVINGEEFHTRGVKQPDAMVKILREIDKLSSFDKAQLRYYSAWLR